MEIPIFYSFSHIDDSFRAKLEIWLEPLRRQGIIEGWSDRRISPGNDWKSDINFNIKRAKIIILLVSPEFLASEYCYDSEASFALEQHKKGIAKVIPIILRPCLWKYSNFSHLKALPKDGRALTTWKNKDLAWFNVVRGILSLIDEINSAIEKSSEEQLIEEFLNGFDIAITISNMNLISEIIPKNISREDLIDILEGYKIMMRTNGIWTLKSLFEYIKNAGNIFYESEEVPELVTSDELGLHYN